MSSSETNLEELYARLVEEEEDDGGVIVAESEVHPQKTTYVLVGRFLTERNIKFNAMQNVLTSLWRPKEGMEVHDTGGIGIRLCFIIHWIYRKLWMEALGLLSKIC